MSTGISWSRVEDVAVWFLWALGGNTSLLHLLLCFEKAQQVCFKTCLLIFHTRFVGMGYAQMRVF